MTPLLDVRDLEVSFATAEGLVPAVDGVSFTLEAGRALGLVGESGCGKSVTALALLALLPSAAGRFAGGEIRFRGIDLLKLPEPEVRKKRGREIALVFQEPMAALNPVFTAGDQVGELLRVHLGASRREARRSAIALLERVGIQDPARRVDSYPHELSGGMRQRVCIAMALACKPALLIADEPTTALDVTVQAQILALLADLRREYGMATLLISHDLGVVAQLCDDVAVMYAGKIVEQGPIADVLRHPLHPYTRGLLESRPRLAGTARPDGRLPSIPGTVPDPRAFPSGCRFHPRCPIVHADCRTRMPPLLEVAPQRRVACPYAEYAEPPAPDRMPAGAP